MSQHVSEHHTSEKAASGPDRELVGCAVRQGDWEALLEALGYQVKGARLTARSATSWGLNEAWVEAFDRVEVAAGCAGLRVVVVAGKADWRMFRRGVIRAARQRPAVTVMWWWVREESVVVACADRHERTGWRMQTLETSRRHPDPSSIEQWTRLSRSAVITDGQVGSSEMMAQHIRTVLEEDGLTRKFFDGFSEALDRLREELRGGPSDEQARHDVALSTLLRCLFLYFLQARDWLDGDRRYIARQLSRCCQNGGNFYDDVLRPLFFGALNRPPEAREEAAERLGDLPFLNGGLFEPLPVEGQWPELTWSNDVWREVIDGLLERYHFTVEPTHGADARRAVDPEMLGKVFEGLMYGNRRKSSGSYYTPRDVVRRMVVNAMAGYLADRTEIDEESLAAWLGGADGGETTAPTTSVQKRDCLREALKDLRFLDPAVGTGAFLLEAFHMLRRVRGQLAETDRDSFEESVALIHTHLYGVDVQQTAVRICELRLWLALLPALRERSIEELPPLPNLGHRVGCGDSLTTPPGRPNGATSAFDGDSSGPSNNEIRVLQGRLLRAHGPKKVDVRRELEATMRARQREILRDRRDELRERLAPYDNIEASEDLFGREVELTSEQASQRARLIEELEEVDAALADLESGRASRASFDFQTRFGPSLSEAGFNVIATNPPWVRTRRIDADQRRHLRDTYRCFRGGLWDGAASAGVSTPFGLQVDLSSVFVERALNLLAPGGRLSVLMPAKGLRSLHGSGLRRLLDDHQIVRVEDFSEASASMFDATVYPAVVDIKARKVSRGAGDEGTSEPTSDGEGAVEVAAWRGSNRSVCHRVPGELRLVSDDPAAPWVVVPAGVLEGLQKLFDRGESLGAVPGLSVQRGVMTGRNRAFIGERSAWVDRLGRDVVEEWTRPVIGGRDISPGGISAGRRIIWPIDEELECVRDIPLSLERYFDQRREALEQRSDFREGRPLWQLFRLNDGLNAPKVVWRDLSPALQAAVAPSEVVALNTVYFIPCPDVHRARSLVMWLHSLPMRVSMRALAERARGGWRRHFAWVMRLMPLPSNLGRWWSGALELEALDGPEREFARFSEVCGGPDERVRRRVVRHIVGWSADEMKEAEAWFLESMPDDHAPVDGEAATRLKLSA